MRTKDLKTRTKEKKLVEVIKANPLESLSSSLKAVGYSDSVANKPSIVTQRPSFIDLMNESGIDDIKLKDKLNEGLDATKLVIYGSEVIEPPDFGNRHKYLETALKLKGHLTPSQVNIQANDYKLIIEDNIDKT